MSRPILQPPAASAPRDPDEADTGLPLLRAWRTVYLFVLGTLILWIGLLAILTRLFS